MKVVDVLGQRRVYRWFLNFLAVACFFIDREWIWKKYYVFMSIFSAFGCGVMLYSGTLYINDIDSLSVIMHHGVVAIDLIVGLQVLCIRRNHVSDLVKDCSKSFDYESQIVSKFLNDLQDKREKSMEKVFKYNVFTSFFMIINVMIFGMVEKYLRNLEFMLLFPCWFPFELSYLPYYLMAYFWQCMLVASLCLTICGAMAIAYIVYSHLTSQITLLKFAIDKLKARAYECAYSTTKEDIKVSFEDRLRQSFIKGTKQCVEHYSMIIDYYTKAKNIFKIMYFMVFLTGIILLTCTGFALISENTSLKIKFIGVNTVQMIYLYIFCWLAEKISDLGESIRLSIYGIEWYEMPRECQSSLILMVERTLRPLNFCTLTGQKVDLENYMDLVKASYSYFNMMLATQQK
nr:odorant receptor 38 [Graphosoma rubrolineatum]